MFPVPVVFLTEPLEEEKEKKRGEKKRDDTVQQVPEA